DLLNLLEDPKSQRQPGIDAGARLADHATAQHQLMGDDFRLLGRLTQDGQEEPGKAHGCPWSSVGQGGARAHGGSNQPCGTPYSTQASAAGPHILFPSPRQSRRDRAPARDARDHPANPRARIFSWFEGVTEGRGLATVML